MFAAALGHLDPARAVLATHPVDAADGVPGVDVFDAGHPSPNQASAAAAERALELARLSRDRGGLLVLLSGGASAMLAAPVDGVTLSEKLETSGRLMRAGAAIHELNCVRKHLSRIKGGRLAAAAGRIITFALSDVHAPVADDPSVIGSGPTVPDDSTFADAAEILARYGVEVPDSVRAHIDRGRQGEEEETIKAGDPRIESSSYRVIGNRLTAMAGAARAAAAAGYRVVTFPDPTTGEARVTARQFVDAALRAARDRSTPWCVVATGETTVTVRGPGRGGRNQEFAIAGAAALSDRLAAADAVLASVGTDGIDGPTDAAGAVFDRHLLSRARAAGLDWRAALEANDAYPFAAGAGALIRWGPTGTNVGDLHVLLIA
jgi:hydroxypyruvate reductase